MYCKRWCVVAVAAVALAVLLGAMGGAALAEQPEPQTRRFALLLMPDAECPDLEDPASVALIAHASGDYQQWSIEMWDQSPELAGTSWFTGNTMVTHVTKGGAQKHKFHWEDAAPPNGAVAHTGPEGDAVFIAGYPIRNVTSAEDPFATNKWTVDWNDSSARILYVGVGDFSK